MPRGDRTGPIGMGSMTGRAAGFCAGYGVPGYANGIPGRGMGMRFGHGRGMGRRFNPPFYGYGGYETPSGYPPTYPKPDPGMESRMLKDQATALQSELESVNRRLAELETEREDE